MPLPPVHDAPGNGQDTWRRILHGSAQSLFWLLALVAIILLSGIILQHYVDVPAFRAFIERQGALAPVVALALIALRAMLFLPILPKAVVIGLASLMFGQFHGALYAWAGTSLGACLAFLVARHWIGDLLLKLKGDRLARLDRVLGSNGLLAVLGFRLVFFSNVFLNYGGGLTSITLRDYAWGTVIGLLPRSFMVSYLFESALGPQVTLALLTYPSLILLALLLLSSIAGIVLLALLARQEYRKARRAARTLGT